MVNLDRLAGAVRTRRGNMSLSEAAQEVNGVSRNTLNQIENCKRSPSLSTFAALCDWIDMPMDYFRDEGDAEAAPA